MKKVLLCLVFPLLLQACVTSCDCFDDCAEVITFQLDTAAGQFIASEIEHLEIQIQLENENDWRISTIDTNKNNRYTFDSLYILSHCGVPFRENHVYAELKARELGSNNAVRIEQIRFITKSDTASLYNLDLIIKESGGISCKCIETLTLKFEQSGEQYTIKSVASRHHILAKIKVD